MHRTLPLLALLLSATLTGCNNDSNDPTPEPKVQQMGYGEVELYDVARRPNGHIIQPGETAVLALEAINGAAAPTPEGDTSNIGIDEVTFDVKDAGPLTLALTEADLAVIAKAELWTLTGGLLAQADQQTPSRTVSLTAGRYLLRVHSGHTQTTPVSLFVYPTVAKPSQTNAQRLYIPAQFYQLIRTNSCSGCDLSGANLTQAPLSQANLTQANLSNAILTQADLTQAHLSQANLSNAILNGANLKLADLDLANLNGANLNGANLDSVDLQEASLINASLLDANLSGADLYEVNLTKANLTKANLTDANLNATTMTGAILTNANLTRAGLDANLTDANLTGANLTGADLSGGNGVPAANLTGANLTDAILTDANLSGATWTDGKTICAPNSIGKCN